MLTIVCLIAAIIAMPLVVRIYYWLAFQYYINVVVPRHFRRKRLTAQ